GVLRAHHRLQVGAFAAGTQPEPRPLLRRHPRHPHVDAEIDPAPGKARANDRRDARFAGTRRAVEDDDLPGHRTTKVSLPGSSGQLIFLCRNKNWVARMKRVMTRRGIALL